MAIGFKYFELDPEGKEEIVKKIREALKKEEEVVFAYLHGGFLERNFFRDVDLAIWLENPEKSFEYVLKLPSALRVSLPVDVQVLNGAPLPFQYRVMTRGRLIVSKDEGLRSRVLDRVVRMYWDLRALLRAYGRSSWSLHD